MSIRHRKQYKQNQLGQLMPENSEIWRKQDEVRIYGLWNAKETLKYFLFIYHHKSKFRSKTLRKSLKVFKQMSRFIQSRNPSQCRTHHQNLIQRYSTIEAALEDFIAQHAQFHSSYQQIQGQLKILEDIDFCEDNSTVLKGDKSDALASSEQLSRTRVDEGQPYSPEGLQSKLQQMRHMAAEHQNYRIQQVIECQHFFNLWAEKVKNLSLMPNF